MDGVSYEPYLVTDDWPIHPSQIDEQLTVGACWQGHSGEAGSIYHRGSIHYRRSIHYSLYSRAHGRTDGQSTGQRQKKNVHT